MTGFTRAQASALPQPSHDGKGCIRCGGGASALVCHFHRDEALWGSAWAERSKALDRRIAVARWGEENL